MRELKHIGEKNEVIKYWWKAVAIFRVFLSRFLLSNELATLSFHVRYEAPILLAFSEENVCFSFIRTLVEGSPCH